MSRGVIFDDVTDTSGNALPGISVTIFEEGTTTKATLYDARVGGNNLDNPLTTNDRGIFLAYLEPGSYDISVAAPTGTFVKPGVPALDPDDVNDLNDNIADINAALDLLDDTGALNALQTVDTLAELRATTPTSGDKRLVNTIGDIWEVFAYDPDDSTSVDDDLTTIVTSGGERWLSTEAIRGEVVTVGTGGDYSTINEALQYLSRKRRSVSSNPPYRATINLLTGFVMEEQVFADGVNLGYVTITSDDAEVTISRAALTETIATLDFDSTPAFLAINGGVLPIIGALFNMDTSGAADSTKQHGVMCAWGGVARVARNCGIKNVTGRGFYGVNGIGYGRDTVWDGAGVYGIRAGNGSLFNVRGASAQNCTSSGLHINSSICVANEVDTTGCNVGCDARNGAIVSFKAGIAHNCGSFAIYNEDAHIVADGSTLTSAGDTAVEARIGGYTQVRDSDLSSPVDRAITASGNARVSAKRVTATSVGGGRAIQANEGSIIDVSSSTISGASIAFGVNSGGIVVATGTSGAGSQSMNIVTENGTIYGDDVSRNGGGATVTSGNGFVDVSHGLSYTPESHELTVLPRNSAARVADWSISNVGATTFRIQLDSVAASDTAFAWRAEKIS